MGSVSANRPEYNPQIDTDLWLALRRGQAEALGKIYDRHAGLVYGISYKVLGNTQEAEDLTQDIFIKLAERATYDPDRGSLRTFLMILTRSRAIDRVRSRQSTQRSKRVWQADYVPESPQLSIDAMVQAEKSEQVKRALTHLSSEQQQILHMAYYEGLSQSAIAKKLSTPLGTIKSRARRGLLTLRKILQSDSQNDY